ncbi:hypothetical protein BST36_25855 [Mycolicibacterium moriokaense]|jgi:hypothetical protein|uniref:Chitin-binding protein n=1 Tax=Mycolicibacterium moriokaense TaxID=39691 RepID=A0AAD1HGK8_9MYCO|nr:hypothetical protein [Mycolicibacterium moriokaense]MCV7041585.1 hypothetical protein [Mycolicibacterium moriokaense]ORB16457.1 hypothetical protein BST36_25855 [Mycolicibacterium moriokaense]BBX03698.1 hypothetical protein MMOR_46340 [Mycolicibacterium moriokaense]
MNVKKRVVTAICAGALAGAALGIGSGVANAGPKWPGPPPPWPVPGPGANFGGPGNPLPPGHGGLPPPGHRNYVVPVWAPPAPPPPYWAPWLPVEWNSELNVWGVHWNGEFRAAPF